MGNPSHLQGCSMQPHREENTESSQIEVFGCGHPADLGCFCHEPRDISCLFASRELGTWKLIRNHGTSLVGLRMDTIMYHDFALPRP